MDDKQSTPLCQASILKTNEHEVCAWIFRNGCNLNNIDERGDNLLTVASYKGAESLVQDNFGTST